MKDEIIERLETIAEQLSELALEELRRAVDDLENGDPAEERRLTRARRAVEKAISVLTNP